MEQGRSKTGQGGNTGISNQTPPLPLGKLLTYMRSNACFFLYGCSYHGSKLWIQLTARRVQFSFGVPVLNPVKGLVVVVVLLLCYCGEGGQRPGSSITATHLLSSHPRNAPPTLFPPFPSLCTALGSASLTHPSTWAPSCFPNNGGTIVVTADYFTFHFLNLQLSKSINCSYSPIYDSWSWVGWSPVSFLISIVLRNPLEFVSPNSNMGSEMPTLNISQ